MLVLKLLLSFFASYRYCWRCHRSCKPKPENKARNKFAPDCSYLRVRLKVYSRLPVLTSKMSPLKMTVSAFVNSAFVPE